MYRLRRSRSPFQIGVLVAVTLISALATVMFDGVATTTARELGPVFGRLMYGGTAVAGAVACVGLIKPGVVGLLVERVGLVSMSCWTAAYGTAVMVNSGVRGLQFGVYMLAVAAMCVARAWQTGKEAREIVAVDHLARKVGHDDEELP